MHQPGYYTGVIKQFEGIKNSKYTMRNDTQTVGCIQLSIWGHNPNLWGRIFSWTFEKQIIMTVINIITH